MGLAQHHHPRDPEEQQKDKSRSWMLLVQDGVGYLCIYTHQVCNLLIYVKGLLEISEQNVRLTSIALVCVVGILAVLCRGEARTDERVKCGNKIQKYSSNWTKFFGDKLF